MITKRDKKIIDFINIFGKTYYKVLGETFFNNEQVARNRINLLVKEKILRTVKLGQEEINAPKTCIVLGSEGKFLIEEMGKSVKDFRTTKRINHNIYEQIAYYYIVQTGTVERTTIANHFKDYKHIPDFILKTNDLTLFVEIELNLKTPNRYIQLIEKTLSSGIDRVLYIVLDEKIALKIYEYLPPSLRDFINFSYITFDDLKKNVMAHSKIKPETYLKTKDYTKVRETIKEETKTVLKPITDDLEIQKEKEVIELKPPTVEPTPENNHEVIELTPNPLFSFLSKVSIISVVLVVILAFLFTYFEF